MKKEIYSHRRRMIKMLSDERRRQGLSQEDVAGKMGVLRSNLSRFEGGEQNPTLDFIIKYAVALDMEPDMVLKATADAEDVAPKTKQQSKKENTGMSNKALFEKIDFYREEINNKRPLTAAEVRELDNYFKIGTTYASNAIEGNTLTLSETKIIIEDGITVGGKPLKYCYEATGHAKAYDYMISIARGDNFEITEEVILKLHKLFYSGIDDEYAGKYRDIQVFITGTEYIPPKASEVPNLMREFVNKLSEYKTTMHPIEYAAYAHRRLVDIHPFVDGNGRTARLLMNLILINRGYVAVSISPVLRFDYMQALQAAQRKSKPSDEAFVRLIAECELEAQKDYFRMFGMPIPKKQRSVDDREDR